MMMVPPSSEEQRARVRTLCHSQTQKFTVESLSRDQVTNVKMDMSEIRLRGWIRLRMVRTNGGKQVFKIKWGCYHRNLAIFPAPLRARTIAVQFHAVAVRIAEINRFTDP